jgi:outer membrane lipoprotein-sorting protein
VLLSFKNRPLKIVIVRRLLCLALVLGFVAPCFAQQVPAESDKLFTAEVLKMTLFARTADEKRFCDYVIQKRDDGTIPTQIIYGVYRIAMTKDRGRRFAYFKSGLEFVCKREGITLYPPSVRTAPAAPAANSLSRINFFRRG